jgi:polyhydroxyalkanoate synthase
MRNETTPPAGKGADWSAVGIDTLKDMQHWTWVIGRAQQMMLEHAAREMANPPAAPAMTAFEWPKMPDPARFALAQADLWTDGLALWTRMLAPASSGAAAPAPAKAEATKDRRFSAPEWQSSPIFEVIRETYLMISDRMLRSVEEADGIDPRTRDKLRFATRTFVDAMSPSNFALTNPQVLARTIETRGENLLKGLEHMLADLARGQVRHTDQNAFEIGRNIAATPGKVVKRTPLYELIQYAPTTKKVRQIPVVIFPPWINRFYILDLGPEKSFIRWAVAQGLTVFVVSWKSADETMRDLVWDDYVLSQIDAIDTVRALLDVPSVGTIGYCVAGTTLAATLALLAARDEADKVASATFFTAQVDFAEAGDLNLLVDDEQLKLVSALAADTGYLDGRYMAATFNLLRGRDLIWNYVVSNYLMGEDYAPFDLLHWNGDTTNLPARWHRSYLEDLYRDNRLVTPGAMTVDGTPIDLTRVVTPAYVQAGREDHIAPAESVWKITHHLRGPLRFVLAGSGHIAGVVNPPDKLKYQFWTNDERVDGLDAFLEGAVETKGSWWPHWAAWLEPYSGPMVPARGARVPGKGSLPAIEDAPGSYVKTR